MLIHAHPRPKRWGKSPGVWGLAPAPVVSADAEKVFRIGSNALGSSMLIQSMLIQSMLIHGLNAVWGLAPATSNRAAALTRRADAPR
jgi:hypothetical protein